MNTMTRCLLSEYYGFGSEGHLEKSFSAHTGLQTLKILPDEVEVSIPEQLDEESNENATQTNNKENENVASHKLDLNVEQRERSSRFLSDEITSTVKDDGDAGYEIFLETNATMNYYVFDRDEKPPINRNESSINIDKTQLLKSTQKMTDTNLTALELETSEVVRSNISSPMPKKRSSRKLRSSVMPLPPLPKKIPVCNGIFLDLTCTGISEFPIDMLDKLSGLKMIYLENNKLEELPDELFTKLNILNWLDVRNNRLTSLPSTIARHPCLETLLLQGNRMEKLPLELCQVPKLKGLQTMRNPLVFPPKDVVSRGCTAILNHLRKEWKKLYPEEVANEIEDMKENEENDRHKNEELKPDLTTILCYKPDSNSVLKKTKRKKKMTMMSRDQLPEISSLTSTSSSAANTDERTVRQKTWDYKPSNRCSSEGKSFSTAMRLTWISKVKEMLGKQALALQRMKDRETLKEWRNDKSSFRKSIEKASKRTAEEIPFAVDLETIPWIAKQDLKIMKTTEKNRKGKRGMIPPTNINTKIEELFESLSRLQVARQTKPLSPRTEQRLLEIEIRKISDLQDEIQSLKYCNDVTVAPPMEGQNSPRKQIQRPPSLII